MIESTEDKVALARRRAELVQSLGAPMPNEDLVRIQGELSVINAKIKAINKTQSAQDRAAANRRKAAGLAEQQANTARARANAGFQHHFNSELACPACGTDSSVGCIAGSRARHDAHEDEDDDPGQTAAVDGWIDAVLLRNDVDFTRNAKGVLRVTNDPKQRAPMDPNLAIAIETLAAGVLAAARGQELPDLPPATSKTTKAPKPKPKKR